MKISLRPQEKYLENLGKAIFKIPSKNSTSIEILEHSQIGISENAGRNLEEHPVEFHEVILRKIRKESCEISW